MASTKDANNTGIYTITSPSGKQYVGSSIDIKKRWRAHKIRLRKGAHHSIHLQHAANKHGIDSFKFDVIVICEPKDLILFEQRAIDAFKPEYNITKTAGSPLGLKRSSEARAKMSVAKLGKPSPKKGISLPEELKARISVALTGRPLDEARKAKLIAANTGRVPSEETKAKIGAWHKNKCVSVETRAKISAAGKGRVLSAETIAKRTAAFNATIAARKASK